jgi:hypothetical protein
MAAGLDNAAVLQHDDAVSIHDGAQPVRDDEGGAIGTRVSSAPCTAASESASS